MEDELTPKRVRRREARTQIAKLWDLVSLNQHSASDLQRIRKEIEDLRAEVAELDSEIEEITSERAEASWWFGSK
jgi:peptidoglycan hydrolase CwlO-like protein